MQGSCCSTVKDVGFDTLDLQQAKALPDELG